MPRVYSERVTYFTLSAAFAVLAGCGSGAGPTLGVDRDTVIIPGEPDDTPASAAPAQLAGPIDGPEEVVPVCQSQFFGADPLAPAQSARSCSYALASMVLNPGNVLVKIAGQPRAAGNVEDGWQLLPDGTTVLLLGLACDDALAGADVELSALCE